MSPSALDQRVAERTREIEDEHVEVLQRLAAATEFRDQETGEHPRRVGRLSGLIAEQMGLPPEVVDNIRRAAPLHDIGLIGIPDSIMLKQTALTDEEQGIMRTHARIGARILAGGQSELLQSAERIALSHHENWTGRGYPDGLAGERIPIEARIVRMVDSFEALTHDRPFRSAWTLQKTLAFIGDESGGLFDPAVVLAFLQLRRAGVDLLSSE
ncbi:MAG TPA: HD domain-containing phosphohydrolase [Gemmatimonadaceae bacterium]|nr:HD domain-containing phosphohydrolase [Gemmatimonadaceae bacterium]